MATVMLANGSGVFLLTLVGIAAVLINGGRSAAAAAIAGNNNSNNNNKEDELFSSLSSANTLMDYNNAAQLASISNLLESSRAVAHKQAILRALEQQQRQRQSLQQDADDELVVAEDNIRPDLYYDPSAEAEQQRQAEIMAAARVSNFEPSQKRAQATYLRFGRSARLRFGKRASLFDDVVLGDSAHVAARRAASARLRFG